jgi:hypothetical protein
MGPTTRALLSFRHPLPRPPETLLSQVRTNAPETVPELGVWVRSATAAGREDSDEACGPVPSDEQADATNADSKSKKGNRSRASPLIAPLSWHSYVHPEWLSGSRTGRRLLKPLLQNERPEMAGRR